MMTFHAPSTPFRASVKPLILLNVPRSLPRCSAPCKPLKSFTSAPCVPCLPLKGEGENTLTCSLPNACSEVMA